MKRTQGQVGRVRRARRVGTAARAFVFLIAIAGMGAVVWAQAPALPTSMLAASPTDVDPGAVRLLVGRSTVLDVGAPIARVSLTSPDIADALVTSPNQLLINGKLPGTISMFVWDRGGSLKRFEVIVQRDLARLSEQVKELFPGEHIEVQSNGKNIVLSGSVTNKDVIERAVNVAAGYVDKRDEVVPLLELQVGAPSNQVLLHVRFAEVDRSALTNLGVNFTTGPGGVQSKGTLFQTSTGQYPGPSYGDFGKGVANPGDGPLTQTFSDLLNLFLFNNHSNIGAVISAMQQRGLFQSLAEPNLVAESGKEASFLAGGEFPVPIAQGTGNNLAVTVQYKEFGVRLTFTPVVTGNRVHLKVRPEVSTLDFANAVVLNGFRIPALSTRRTETELELENGQTFAVSGLMNNTVNNTMQKIPGIGDIPILGQLFHSKAAQKNQTELVVMITPEILPNNSTGAAGSLPRTPEHFMPPLTEKNSMPMPPVSHPGGSADAAPAVLSPTAHLVDPPAPAAAVASQIAPRPLTDHEQKAVDKAYKQEQQHAAELAKLQAKADAKAKVEQDKQAKKQAEIDAKAKAEQDKQAKKQAELDAKAEAAAKKNTKS
jgi:pilus assembly protein CpaC